MGETIYRSEGTEGTCPICAKRGYGGNAMLDNRHWKGDVIVPSLKCRDCGYVVNNPQVVVLTYEELIKIKY